MFKRYLTILTIVIALAASTASAKAHKPRKIQRVTVSLTGLGYKPESFRLKRGIPARLAFIRKTASDCGEVLVIPAYGIRRYLPLNKAVIVNFTPRQTGTFNFMCGMDMLRGQIIVN